MRIFLDIVGMLLGFVFILKREMIGDIIGDHEWMSHVGGVYNVVVFIGIFLFLWGIADMTDTTAILFAPLRLLIPAIDSQPVETI